MGDRERAKKLYEDCARRGKEEASALLEHYKRSPVIVTNAAEDQALAKAAKTAIAGYVGAGIAGAVLARWLARPTRSVRYRPGLIAQLGIVSVTTVAVGGAIAARAAMASTADIIEADGQLGDQLCRMVGAMEPCVRDPECRRLLEKLPAFARFQACQRREARLGGTGVRTPVGGASRDEFGMPPEWGADGGGSDGGGGGGDGGAWGGDSGGFVPDDSDATSKETVWK